MSVSMVSSDITFVTSVMKVLQLIHNCCPQFKFSVYPYTKCHVLEKLKSYIS